MLVKIKPLSKRAKERVNKHGSTMRLIKKDGNKILVESLNETWFGQKWAGWCNSSDVEIVESV